MGSGSVAQARRLSLVKELTAALGSVMAVEDERASRPPQLIPPLCDDTDANVG